MACRLTARLQMDGHEVRLKPTIRTFEELLELFQRHVLDEAYRVRLRRHHQLFRDELRRRRNIEPPT